MLHSSGANFRLNPNNGALAATDTPAAPARVAAAAYDRSVATATVTTLYAIDDTTSTLNLIGGPDAMPSPNLGATTVRGPLGVTIDDDEVGFDISPVGEAVATLSVGGSTGLYRIDLASGAATLLGTFGTGALDVLDIAALSKTPAAAGQFNPVAATRLLDTRQGGTKPGPNTTVDVAVVGAAGIPTSATAVVLNLTGTEATEAGYLTVFPKGQARPVASNNNLAMNGTKANLVVSKIGADGSVSVFVDRGTHLVVDVVGYYGPATSAAGRFTALTGGRLVDTRSTAKLAANTSIDVAVAGQQGVPATGVSAVLVNLTATEATSPGYFVAYATGQSRPSTSSLNVGRTNGTASNLAIVPLGTDGTITVYSEFGANVIVDVAGWFSDATGKGGASGLFVPVDATRLLDTRNAVGSTAGALPRGATVDVRVGGAGGVPANNVGGVLANVTLVEATAPGFATVYPTGTTAPTASNLNADVAGETVPNLVASPLGTGNQLTILDDAGGHVLLDVAGWFIR